MPNSWIGEYLNDTAEFESPERYFYWSALSAVSAVIKRNVFLDRFIYKLYPNLGVLLVGPSGVRKGPPVGNAQKLVEEIKCTRVFSGRGSIQGVIKELAKAYTQADKSITTDACGFLVSAEFDAMLVHDDQAFTILTDLYDTHFKDDWKNIIKVAGKDELKNVYLTMLGASNEENLHIPKNAVGGGWVARTIIVYEERKKLINSLVTRPKRVPNIKQLSKRLYEVTHLKGEFKFDNTASTYYDAWYHDFMKLEAMDKTGTLDRIPDTVLKVAMNISLSKKDDLILCKCDIEESIERCLECVPGMKKVFLASGEHSLAKPTAHVLKILITRESHMMTRKRMLRELLGEADAIDLDRIIDTLSQANAIDVLKDGVDIVYKMKEETVTQFQRLVQEEEK